MGIDEANQLRALIIKLKDATFNVGKGAKYYDEWIAAGDAVEAFITNHTE